MREYAGRSAIRARLLPTVMVASLALLVASCGSDNDSTADEVSETTVAPTTEAETIEISADAGGQIRIETELLFNDTGATGTFNVTEGADLFGCESGTSVDIDHGPPMGVDKTMTCESGSRSGTITVNFEPIPNTPWTVVDATGDFAGMSGIGEWTGEAIGDTAAETLTGEITFGDLGIAAALSTTPRLVQGRDDCSDGFVATGGLREYASIEGQMLSKDLVTAEVTDHGPPPEKCVLWLGDEAVGRKVAQSLRGKRVWLAALDGEWEPELTYETPRQLISRTLTGNRMIWVEFDTGLVFIADATTGEQIGEPIVGSFANGRDFSANATMPDGSLIAVGGANPATGGGQITVLDAETAEPLFQIDAPEPATSMIFDSSTNELIAGLTAGEVITIDLTTGEIVSQVNLSVEATIGAIGLRADGLVVAHTDRQAELVDRRTGPTGQVLKFANSIAARIQPDGAITSWTSGQQFEMFTFDG